MNLIDVANELIAEGLNPLPLWNSKAPMLEAGHNFLYETITDVDSRFLKAEKIGIACGLVSEFYCIDFDCHNGEPIKDTFDEIFYKQSDNIGIYWWIFFSVLVLIALFFLLYYSYKK